MLYLVAQLCPTFCDPLDCCPPGSSVHGDSPGKTTRGLPCPPPEDFPNPRTEPRSPSLQVDSLPAEPPGNPKSTGVGGLSLLQGIFPTQESDQGLRHCRQTLYQLSYRRSPLQPPMAPQTYKLICNPVGLCLFLTSSVLKLSCF